MKEFLEKIGLMILGIAMIAVFAFVPAILVKLLWNALMPSLFGLPVLTYWQSYGMWLLCWLLFGKSGSSSSKD